MTTATMMKIPNDDVLDEPSIARGSSCDGGLVASSSRQAESVVVLDDDALGGTSGIVASEVSEVDNEEVKMSPRKNQETTKAVIQAPQPFHQLQMITIPKSH